MNHSKQIIALSLLLFAIGFNLWLYRLEPTALLDPNDNTFQYALVDRTNQMWDFADKTCLKNLSFVICHLSFLVDHWVPNWAQGYNLPTYYSHVPQILIVGSYRLLSQFSILPSQFSLFQYYHLIIYLLLCLFPLSVFLALRIIRLHWLIAGIGALLASHLSTDGLYGLDSSSFLWRGYGLSSQLFAMIPLPLALAYSFRYFSSPQFSILNSQFLLPIFFLIATISGHLGIGIIAIMSLIPLALAEPVMLFLQQPSIYVTIQPLFNNFKKLFILAGTTIFFLSYWIVPVLLNDNYHNISFWDPPWKFNSYGAKEIITRLLNGDLFDFGRLPILTVLIIVGIIAVLLSKNREWRMENGEWRENSNTNNSQFSILNSQFSFAFLFLFWLVFYFGRSTWGGLIDLIPSMKEFHLSRFIVGLHVAGLFLIPIGIWWTIEQASHGIVWLSNHLTIQPSNHKKMAIWLHGLMVTGILIVAVPVVYSQTIRYSNLNNTLILQANANYTKVKTDTDLLITELKTHMVHNPGRVYFGRGGNWGKDLKVAETPYYIYFSTYGIPTVLWLPQTWSPNSDIEQYFTEENQSHYDLFGIRYVVTPPNVKPLSFWKFIKETASWKLYEVPSSVYITSGIRPTIVSSDKRSYANVIRLWIQTDKTHNIGLYPELTFAKDYPRKTGLPNFRMLNEVTYQVPDESVHNLFREPPLYLPPGATSSGTLVPFNTPTILSKSMDSDMIYTAKVRVPDPCTECIIILKQSGNPNWNVTIDGKKVDHFNVFPVFVAVSVPPGDHDIVFSYEPSKLKVLLLFLSVTVLVILVVIRLKNYVSHIAH